MTSSCLADPFCSNRSEEDSSWVCASPPVPSVVDCGPLETLSLLPLLGGRGGSALPGAPPWML